MNWLLALCLGACAMFFLDPDHGKRRRALIRDKGTKLNRVSREELDGRSRDLRNRLNGMLIEFPRFFTGGGPASQDQSRRTLPRFGLRRDDSAQEESMDREPVGTTTRRRSSGPTPTYENGGTNPVE